MAHRTTFGVLGTVVAVIAVMAVPATGHDVKPSGMLTFTGKAHTRDRKVVDVAPNAISVGDRFLTAATLRQAGAIAGRASAFCVGSTGPHSYAGIAA